MAVPKIATKGNKPGEPPFKLELDTKDVLNIRWEKNMGATFTDLKITNPFDDYHTFKVKTTDTAIFRVRPPVAAIEPKASIDVRIIQHAAERPLPNKHFLAILHMKCTAVEAKKKLIWRAETKPEGIIRIPIAFVDPAPATPVASPAATPAAPSPTSDKPAAAAKS